MMDGDRDRAEELRQQAQIQEESSTRQQLHTANFGSANSERHEQMQFLEAAVSNKDLETGTQQMLINLLSRNLPLANLSGAEAHEVKWRLEYTFLRVIGMHPAEGSLWTGEFVQEASGGSDWALRPLSQPEVQEIQSLIDQIWMRATRGRNGFQWDKLNESISVARTEDPGEDDDGGLF